jgi:Rps23 Pro-64 3,4-dihydroxylase Tpa1-like proline 4-hydroxylase
MLSATAFPQNIMKRKAEDSPTSPPSKKANTSPDPKAFFRDDLFAAETRKTFTSSYKTSQPYPHAVIPSLIQDKLLRDVRKEITEHVHFTLKETDIYRIHQSGDLANLSKLAAEDLKHLPSLVALRDAFYSDDFRTWISDVTGAGKVSGRKTDMAVNVYTPGSYLLCHDDVIGSRRVSYILYLTDPEEPWKPEWGGGLRLYPTEAKKDHKGEEVKVPLVEHTVNIPPSFGQLSFFAVRPGESYHDVEEVYHGKDGKRIRMAISGWYHIPQEGEDGYEEGAEEAQAQKSSLAQLQGAADEFDEPSAQFENLPNITADDDDILTEDELTFLLKYITPQYLTPEMTEKLASSFIEDSVIQLENFLRSPFVDEMKHYITNLADTRNWPVARPPHKHRFQYRRSSTDHTSPFQKLLSDLLPSAAFVKWLGLITSLAPGALFRQNVLVRRFRKGQDYALASAYLGEEPRLEYTIGLTPDEDVEVAETSTAESNGNSNGNGNDGNGAASSLAGINVNIDTPDSDDHGGQEVYMAADDDEEEGDPSSTLPQVGKKAAHDPAVYKAGEEEEEDAILFTDSPSWNTLSLVMRDQGTLRFVKYVGRAGRDRWDVKGEVDLDPELGDDEDNVGSNDEVAHELDDDEDDGDEDDLDTDESADDVSEPASSSDEEQVQQRGV